MNQIDTEIAAVLAAAQKSLAEGRYILAACQAKRAAAALEKLSLVASTVLTVLKEGE